MRVNVSKTLQCSPGDLTAGAIRAFLNDEPDDARVTVSSYSPDRPGDLTTVRLEVTSDVDLQGAPQ